MAINISTTASDEKAGMTFEEVQSFVGEVERALKVGLIEGEVRIKSRTGMSAQLLKLTVIPASEDKGFFHVA